MAGVILVASFCSGRDENGFVQQNLDFADSQLKAMLLALDVEPNRIDNFPRTTDGQGKMVTTNMYDWTPGFFPGSLWYAYQNKADAAMKAAAIRWTEKLEPLKDFKDHHDLGFMMYCSYGNAYRLTDNQQYRDHLVQAARSLCTRFNPTVGCIKSWNKFQSWHGETAYYFPVIIDNMMNLELLFFATEVTGDSSFYKIAVTHADNTLRYQFREDHSSYHVVCYDTLTGKVLGRETAQGFADNSTWSRGQAWAIYGYTMTYRKTKDPRYLQAAMGMADFYLGHRNLPADKVPYWDFNIGQSGYTPGVRSYAVKESSALRDVSAAAITTSGLFELSQYAGDQGPRYKQAAIDMLHVLASPAYKASPGENGHFLLKHSVGSIPHQTEIDVPLVYADYYFLEALHRYKQLLQGKDLLH